MSRIRKKSPTKQTKVICDSTPTWILVPIWDPTASLVSQVPQVYNQSLPLDPSVWIMELRSTMKRETTVFFKTCFRSKCLICVFGMIWLDAWFIISSFVDWTFQHKIHLWAPQKLGEDILRQTTIVDSPETETVKIGYIYIYIPGTLNTQF